MNVRADRGRFAARKLYPTELTVKWEPMRSRMFLLVSAAIALSAAACGGPSSDSTGSAGGSSGGSSGGVASVTVGVSPSIASASAYLAAKGTFAAEGLDVKFSTIQSGAEAIPRLLNGELAFALGDPAGTVTAASNGVELTVTSVATLAPSNPEQDFSGIIALKPELTSVIHGSG